MGVSSGVTALPPPMETKPHAEPPAGHAPVPDPDLEPPAGDEQGPSPDLNWAMNRVRIRTGNHLRAMNRAQIRTPSRLRVMNYGMQRSRAWCGTPPILGVVNMVGTRNFTCYMGAL